MAPDVPRPGGPLGWSAQMRDELTRLPETAANIREASENLRRVSAELVDVSAMLTRILRLMETAGVTEGLARVERVSGELEAVRRAMTPPTSLDEARDRLAQVEEMVFGLSKGVLRTVGFGGGTQRPRGEAGATAGGSSAGPDAPHDEASARGGTGAPSADPPPGGAPGPVDPDDEPDRP